MCGIAGYVSTAQGAPLEPACVAQAMEDRLACRGPDDAGRWSSATCVLVHRRLIVVDPQGGAQPMVLRHGGQTLVLTYNGELYNTPELRQRLEGLGHTFQGHSDTEVLLHALAQWGTDALALLDGIFAFALWNETHKTLLLARDRLGVKPLFYALRPEVLVFGSEIKALLEHPQVRREVTAEGLAEVLALGPARTPGLGIFRDVRELRPGRFLTWSPSRGAVEHTYWRLQSAPHSHDAAQTVAMVRQLLADAVRRQLVSDVPLGTFLSGGVDSSAVSALAAPVLEEEGRGPLRTFSVTFAGQDTYFQAGDFQTSLDAPWVEVMARWLGSRHREVTVDVPELVAAHRDALVARDHPGMADVDASLLVFSRAVKEDVTVCLSGEAADEIFGGYPWCHRPDALAASTFPWALRLADRVRLLSPEVVRFIRPVEYVERRYQEALEEVPRLTGETGADARLREILYLNITRFLPTLLDRKDRMSMAVGLEVRVPFCDHRLVEYVWNIPWSLKNLGGMPKGVLRAAVADLLPPEVAWRRKSPYPSIHHPGYGEAMRALLRERWHDSSSPLRWILRPDQVETLLEAPLRTTDLPWFGQLMGLAQMFAYLVQVDDWWRTYRVSVVGGDALAQRSLHRAAVRGGP